MVTSADAAEAFAEENDDGETHQFIVEVLHQRSGHTEIFKVESGEWYGARTQVVDDNLGLIKNIKTKAHMGGYEEEVRNHIGLKVKYSAS